MSLQNQLRKQLADAAVSGAFVPGIRLPSSRALAGRLGLSRNTVMIAYQKLLDEGLFISRERSRLYVNHALLKGRVQIGQGADQVAGPMFESARSDTASSVWTHWQVGLEQGVHRGGELAK